MGRWEGQGPLGHCPTRRGHSFGGKPIRIYRRSEWNEPEGIPRISAGRGFQCRGSVPI